MKSVAQNLLPKLVAVKQYLSAKIHRQTSYQELIAEIDLLIDTIDLAKPKIKLISLDLHLANKLKNLSEEMSGVAQHLKFQAIEIDNQIQCILSDCEFVFLLLANNSKITELERKMTQQAQNKKIDLKIIIVTQSEEKNVVKEWLEIQDLQHKDNLLWSQDNYIYIDCWQSIDRYQKYLTQLYLSLSKKIEIRLKRKALRLVKSKFENYKQLKWQEIRQQKNNFFNGLNPEYFRQIINKLSQTLNKKQQQNFYNIKQTIQRQKSLINNPFIEKSLIWQTQQLIKDIDVSIITIDGENYLTPMVRIDNSLEPLHLHLVNLYQQKFQASLQKQWHECNNVYNNGGLSQLRSQLTKLLEPIAQLEKIEIEQYRQNDLEFQIDNLVYLPILEEGSRIPFEYNFNQSQWFKIIVAAVVAVGIYLITSIMSGEGRFFGFFILIFQFINLFTGQDIKTVKLKQHTKELKRQLTVKYQTLVRLSVDKITQDTITALDKEHQDYQRQIDTILQAANAKISTVKAQIESDREEINLLNQDLQDILALLED